MCRHPPPRDTHTPKGRCANANFRWKKEFDMMGPVQMVESADRLAAGITVAFVTASVAVHVTLQVCLPRHVVPALLLLLPAVVGAFAWHGVVRGDDALTAARDSAVEAAHQLKGAIDAINAVDACDRSHGVDGAAVHVDELESLSSAARGHTDSAIDAITVVSDHMHVITHAVVATSVVSLGASGLKRWLFPSLGVACCASVSAALAGLAGVVFVFASSVITAVCRHVDGEVGTSAVFLELVEGKGGRVTADIGALLNLTSGRCAPEMRTLQRLLAPRSLGGVYAGFHRSVCTDVAGAFGGIGACLAVAACTPLLADLAHTTWSRWRTRRDGGGDGAVALMSDE